MTAPAATRSLSKRAATGSGRACTRGALSCGGGKGSPAPSQASLRTRAEPGPWHRTLTNSRSLKLLRSRRRFQVACSIEATDPVAPISFDSPPRHRALLRTGSADSHSHERHLSWVVPVVRSAYGLQAGKSVCGADLVREGKQCRASNR